RDRTVADEVDETGDIEYSQAVDPPCAGALPELAHGMTDGANRASGSIGHLVERGEPAVQRLLQGGSVSVAETADLDVVLRECVILPERRHLQLRGKRQGSIDAAGNGFL